jgi:hypothetical protein
MWKSIIRASSRVVIMSRNKSYLKRNREAEEDEILKKVFNKAIRATSKHFILPVTRM